MTTDRELLELAAKAAGVNLYVWGTPGAENFADMDANQYGRLWKPLTDDGDALRLAVKLRLDVNVGDGNSAASWAVNGRHLGNCVTEPHESDLYAATRRAIVRAAAAIAKGGAA